MQVMSELGARTVFSSLIGPSHPIPSLWLADSPWSEFLGRGTLLFISGCSPSQTQILIGLDIHSNLWIITLLWIQSLLCSILGLQRKVPTYYKLLTFQKDKMLLNLSYHNANLFGQVTRTIYLNLLACLRIICLLLSSSNRLFSMKPNKTDLMNIGL